MTVTTPTTATKPDKLALRDIWLIVVACSALSAVVAAMASLNVALAEIAPDIGADSAQITWLVDGYTLTLAALLLPCGALGDRFGRRGVLVVGLVIFAIASALAIVLSTPEEIIATRVIAGAGAALVMPATLSLITSGVPESRRPLAVGIWAGVAGAGAILGFLVTGVLLEFFSWHSIFIAFAVAAASMALLSLTIGSSRDANPPRFDVLGSITSAVAVAAFVFGLIEGPIRGWADPLVLVGLVGGLVLAAIFVWLQLRGTRTLLDVRLFRRRAFGAGSFAIALQFIGSFGVFFLVLQRFQIIMGYSPLKSALALIPLVVVVMVMSLVGTWAAVRFSFRAVMPVGMFVFGVAIVVLGVYDSDTYWVIAAELSVMAFGIGLAGAPATTGIMVSTPADNQGIASAVNDTSRELGAAIGMALAGSIVAAGFTTRISGTVDAAREQLRGVAQQLSASGRVADGQAILGQIDTITDRIGKSLAEASAVADQLRQRIPGPVADTIASGARDAFLAPMSQAYIVLGSIVVAGSVVLFFWTPTRMPDAQDAAPIDTGEPRSGEV
ncbi:MFS transporter [Williamsia deligens]|uniref:MFS transporter n=1 Tax=Williamsia deligens TaxID=321325 RepID=A0ABW3G7N8_9NOCA|nr:MFS transporter [Williamsia deligens]MCP2193003.1 drug resistance transporter, EmrB/QacA subfamily [Williamsia deligens]